MAKCNQLTSLPFKGLRDTDKWTTITITAAAPTTTTTHGSHASWKVLNFL